MVFVDGRMVIDLGGTEWRALEASAGHAAGGSAEVGMALLGRVVDGFPAIRLPVAAVRVREPA